jgi:hypothetical protein
MAANLAAGRDCQHPEWARSLIAKAKCAFAVPSCLVGPFGGAPLAVPKNPSKTKAGADAVKAPGPLWL